MSEEDKLEGDLREEYNLSQMQGTVRGKCAGRIRRAGVVGFLCGLAAAAVGLSVAFLLPYLSLPLEHSIQDRLPVERRPQTLAVLADLMSALGLMIGIVIALWLWGAFVGGKGLGRRSLSAALAAAGIAFAGYAFVSYIFVSPSGLLCFVVVFPLWGLFAGGMSMMWEVSVAFAASTGIGFLLAFVVTTTLGALASATTESDAGRAMGSMVMIVASWYACFVLLGLGFLGAMETPAQKKSNKSAALSHP